MGLYIVLKRSKNSIARDACILALVSDYDHRDTLSYLKGMAYNLSFKVIYTLILNISLYYSIPSSLI